MVSRPCVRSILGGSKSHSIDTHRQCVKKQKPRNICPFVFCTTEEKNEKWEIFCEIPPTTVRWLYTKRVLFVIIALSLKVIPSVSVFLCVCFVRPKSVYIWSWLCGYNSVIPIVLSFRRRCVLFDSILILHCREAVGKKSNAFERKRISFVRINVITRQVRKTGPTVIASVLRLPSKPVWQVL